MINQIDQVMISLQNKHRNWSGSLFFKILLSFNRLASYFLNNINIAVVDYDIDKYSRVQTFWRKRDFSFDSFQFRILFTLRFVHCSLMSYHIYFNKIPLSI